MSATISVDTSVSAAHVKIINADIIVKCIPNIQVA